MSEPSLFDALHQLPPQAIVNRQRDEALRKVAQHAEDRTAGFLEDARAFVVRYLEVHGPTAGEVLTAACKAEGIRAHDDRAMGPVFMGLARRGVIVKAGTVNRLRGHNTAGGNIWGLVR